MLQVELVEPQALSARDAAILDFEKNWWQLPGTKESEIRARFDLSTTRYYEVLNTLISREESLAYDPLLVKRLRRQRLDRQRSRTAARIGLSVR